MTYCGGCGSAAADGDHAACVRLLAFDPPRWCAACGHRLDVQVFPDGYRSRCRECRRRAAQKVSGGR